MEEVMSKKYVFIGLVVAVVLVGGGYYVYGYWQHGTPEYSARQLQQAVANQDTSTAEYYFDVDAIWSNLWPRYESGLITLGNFNSLAAAIINNQEATIKNVFTTSVYGAIRGQYGSSNLVTIIVNALPTHKFSVHDSTALANVTFVDSDGVNTPITVVLTQQANRLWKITDLQGAEKIMIRAALKATNSN